MGETMTANEFVAECEKRCILPEMALENQQIRQALADRDDSRAREVLDAEF